jgi:hypothetical protein
MSDLDARESAAQTFVTAGAVAIIGPGVPSGVLAKVRAALVGPAPMDAVLVALTSTGWSNLPNFGFAFREGQNIRLLLRGTVTAHLVAADGQVTWLSGADVATWTEHSAVGPIEVCLAEEGAAPVTLLLAPAVMPSTAATVPATTVPPTPTAAAVPVPAAVVEPIPSATSPEATAVSEAEVEGEDFDFSHLLSDTRFHDVESAAVRPPEEDDENENAPAVDPRAPDDAPAPDTAATLLPGVPFDDQPLGEDPAVPAEPPWGVPGPADDTGLIDGFPGRASPTPAGSRTPAAAQVSQPQAPATPSPGYGTLAEPRAAAEAPVNDETDGRTISVAELRIRMGLDRLGEEPAPGPRVQAVLCINQHPNPPHAPACRTCGGPITERTVTIVVRPPLGVLRFEDGHAVELDRGVLIGRKPVLRAPAASGPLPRLVAVPDPDKMLSRVHLEVRLDDWRVAVIDHDSRNGSTIEVPGQPLTKLRPGELSVITPGTRVVLGEVTRLVYQVGAP